MPEAMKRNSGGCLCGAVRYEVAGGLRGVIACHCGQCRRQHGSFGLYSEAALAEMTINEAGGLAWYDSSAKARRGFCRHCGSALFWHRAGALRMAIAAGSLDQPTGLKVVQHIYVDDKADYEEIADGLPQLTGSQSG
jgi:hypothetical protein